jgi:hypothetical protein
MIDQRTEDLVEKLLEGRLDPIEQVELEAKRAENPDLDRFIDAERELRAMIGSRPKPEFEPFFGQRVLKRVFEERENSMRASGQSLFDADFSAALARLFPRIAVPGFALSGLVMASNASAASSGATLAEALFALPTLDTVSLLIF